MSEERAQPTGVGKTALIDAVKNNNESEVERLINAGDCVNETDEQGKTALFYANESKNWHVVCELVANRARFELNEIDGKAVLFYAAENGMPGVVQRLYFKHLDVNMTNDNGKTALYYAIENKNWNVVCDMIFSDIDFELNEIDGKAVLFYAAENGMHGVVKPLHDKGLDINLTDDDGKTALFYALNGLYYDEDESVVSELIEAGANVNIRDNQGKTALFYAVNGSYYDEDESVVSQLIEAGVDVNITDNQSKTALFYANENKNWHFVCELIAKWARFKLNEIDGKAVLFYAAENGMPGVVQRLYFKHLDVNMTNDNGKTALFYAVENKNWNVVCDIIYWNIDFELNEIDGKAVLFYAAENDMHGVVKRLYDKGLDLNITDDEGKTALFYANENESWDVVCELLEFHAYFELNYIDGKAVLFYAAENGMYDVVGRLCDKGLDVNVTDNDGKTVLFYVTDEDFYENFKNNLVRELIEVGADVNIKDNQSKTALFYANKNKDLSVVCELIKFLPDFELKEIDGKAILFRAAEFDISGVVGRLCDKGLDVNITDDNGRTALFHVEDYFYDDIVPVLRELIEAGADVNITDNQGKTALFYIFAEDSIDALIEKGKAFVNARDVYGRTALFYAMTSFTKETAKHLIEKGGNIHLKDNCNASVFSFLIENCITKKISELKNFGHDLFQGQQERKALTNAIVDIIYCQTPLLSISGLPSLPKSYMILQKKSLLEALTFAQDFIQHDQREKDIFNEIKLKISSEEEIDVLRVLSLLNELNANPNSVDSDGNTALHYATLLPLFAVTQETVMEICNKLRVFGAMFDFKNHQKQTPLLFCLSANNWKFVGGNNQRQNINGMIQVCKFLLKHGSSVNETSKNGESVFHLIIEVIKNGLKLHDKIVRHDVLRGAIELLQMFSSGKVAEGNVVSKIDVHLNSPLHLWASLALPSPQYYTNNDQTFKKLLKMILFYLSKCGSKLNARNENDETPLHLCKTWSAVKLLIDAGANPNDVDSSKRAPLFAAARNNLFLKKDACFYPDVSEDPKPFWKTVIEKGLDPWTADKQDECVLSILIESEAFVLAKSLIEVACENDTLTDTKLVLLRVICKDESRQSHWKAILVETILKSAIKCRINVEQPLRLCCKNIVQFGMLDDKSVKNLKSFHGGQPPNKKRKKDESSDESGDRTQEDQETYDSVYCKIAKQLLLYGVDIRAPDSSGKSCLDIAETCPALKDLLTNPMDIDKIPLLIPWTSVSNKYKSILAKVARGQECELVDPFWYHRIHIGSGSFGHIFAGINVKDGREVAIKRIEKLRINRPEDKKEIRNLAALADCQQVVRYLSFFEDQHFSFVVLELMEGNLDELFNESTIDASRSTSLCKDVVMGMKYLHGQNILHRDLKPANILYKVHPELCLKIADFGLSRRIDSTTTTVYGTNVGTRCWIAPEVLKSNADHSKPSDMFSCGLLLHYILSAQKHPFSPADCANKSEMQIAHETEANIMNSAMEGWQISLSPEATQLVTQMLESDKNNRPTAVKALDHLMFWSQEKKIDLLTAVGNQKEFECPRKKRTPPLTIVEIDLDNSFSTIVSYGKWNDKRYSYMPAIYAEMKKGRKSYDTHSVVELVRFIRNAYTHVSEDTRPIPIRKNLLEDFVFLDYFPHLVMEVYKVVTTHGWDRTREEIQYAMNK